MNKNDFLQSSLNKCKPNAIDAFGTTIIVNPTPDNIRDNITIIPRRAPRYYVKIKESKLKKQLIKEQVESNNETSGIYSSLIDFPDKCCVCNAPRAQWELVEIKKLRISGKNIVFPSENVAEAIQCDRIWFAIPFCPKHSLKDHKVDINDSDYYYFSFIDENYAKEFAKINNQELYVLNKSTLNARLITTLIAIFGIPICLILGSFKINVMLFFALLFLFLAPISLILRLLLFKGKMVDL